MPISHSVRQRRIYKKAIALRGKQKRYVNVCARTASADGVFIPEIDGLASSRHMVEPFPKAEYLFLTVQPEVLEARDLAFVVSATAMSKMSEVNKSEVSC